MRPGRYNIPHKNCGKLLMPKDPEEVTPVHSRPPPLHRTQGPSPHSPRAPPHQVKLLPRVLAIAAQSGAEGLRLVTEPEIRDLEPNVSLLLHVVVSPWGGAGR
jgi:hypothetical protein